MLRHFVKRTNFFMLYLDKSHIMWYIYGNGKLYIDWYNYIF